jgi:hypothetical protein
LGRDKLTVESTSQSTVTRSAACADAAIGERYCREMFRQSPRWTVSEIGVTVVAAFLEVIGLVFVVTQRQPWGSLCVAVGSLSFLGVILVQRRRTFGGDGDQ